MSAETSTTAPASCPTCGASLTSGAVCPRCLFGDALAVFEGPVLPKPTPPPTGPTPRRHIGEYDLVEELGRGGMGIVWKAKHRRLNRTVALKLVRGGCLPGEAAAKRFRREAEAAAQLKHPNIVTIHEVGEYDEQLYLSMDLVEGGSLADWLKRVAFSPHDAAVLLAKVARGVHHAHENHVLHRDLKPGNILLSANGEPLVCDFGLARLGDTESSLTLSGELLGTPAYLSPEQASGKMRDLTPASDTYSLGAIFYEMLCGQPPFSAESIPALLRKVAEDDPQRPNSHYSGGRVPFDLSTICLKCLEKDPAARFPTALALAEDLERWLRGEPIVARPVARVERVWKWVRRKPVLAGLWFGITILATLFAVFAAVMGVHLNRERKAVAKLAETSRHQVARQLSESAQRYIGGGDYLRALPALAESIRIGTGDPRLDEADRIRFAMLLRSSPSISQAWLSGSAITRAEASLDGDWLLLATEKSAEVWNIPDGKRVGDPLELPEIISNVQFDSTAGQWALLETGGKLLYWEPAKGTSREIGKGQIFTPPDSFLQRGHHFVSYSEKVAEVRTLSTGQRVAGPFTHAAVVNWATVLPGLDRVLSSDADGIVYLWDIGTGNLAAEPLRLGTGKRPVNFDAYDAMQKRAALHRERDCWTIDCQTGKLGIELRDAEDSPQTIGFDNRGNWLFMARNNDGVTLRYLSDGTIRWSWLHHGLGFRGSFAPYASGSGLVATQSWNGSTRVWRISNGRPSSPFLWQTATPGSCILDPKGRWLLTRGDEPAARLWQLREEDGAMSFPKIVENPLTGWFASGPERIFVADEEGTVQAWESELPRRRSGTVRHPEGGMSLSGPSGDARRFYTAGARAVQVWDASTFAAVGPAQTSEQRIVSVAIDAPGARTATAFANGQVEVRDVASGQVKASFKAAAQQLEFSVNGVWLLVVDSNAARVWNAVTGQPVSPAVESAVGETRARFSPDGGRVLQWGARQASEPVRAMIWDAQTGDVKTKLAPHWQAIGDAAWSPDGRLVATGGADQTLFLSDAETGSPVVPPIKHAQKVSSVGFSKDGLLMWSLAEKEITVWSTVTGEPVTPRLRQYRTPLAVTLCGDDMRHLAVIGHRSAPRLWRLAPDLRDPEELKSIAHALSAHALVSGTSALRPLTLVEMRSAWESARKALGAW